MGSPSARCAGCSCARPARASTGRRVLDPRWADHRAVVPFVRGRVGAQGRRAEGRRRRPAHRCCCLVYCGWQPGRLAQSVTSASLTPRRSQVRVLQRPPMPPSWQVLQRFRCWVRLLSFPFRRADSGPSPGLDGRLGEGGVRQASARPQVRGCVACRVGCDLPRRSVRPREPQACRHAGLQRSAVPIGSRAALRRAPGRRSHVGELPVRSGEAAALASP